MKSFKDKISVVIPTFNRASTLPRAINSVLNQTVKPYEVIVVDDGSTDNTKELIKNYPIKYIHQKNNGVSSARNRGIKEAKGEWIAFLDSDDEWKRDKLQKQIDNLSNTLFSHTAEEWIRDGKTVKYPKRLKKPSRECFLDNLPACKVAASSVLMHRSIFEDVGYFDEKLLVCEDYEFWLRASLKYKISLCEDKLVTKYAGSDQLSNTIKFIDLYHIKILKKFLHTRYKKEILEEIDRKKSILLQGALKHNNKEIIDYIRMEHDI